MLARVNAEARVLSGGALGRLVAHLAHCVSVAERTQQPDGSWPAWWNHELLPGGQPSGGSIADDDLNRLLMTGHLAEWLLYLPADAQVPRSVLARRRMAARAGGAANRQDEELAVCPYSHAVRVLKQVGFRPMEAVPHRLFTEEVTLGGNR